MEEYPDAGVPLKIVAMESTLDLENILCLIAFLPFSLSGFLVRRPI
jgi:hypothetical protein